eukprot:544141_1
MVTISKGGKISIVYASCYLMLLLIFSLKIYLSQKDTQRSFKHFLSEMWKKRHFYLPIALHAYDTATDFGVLYEWYNLAEYEKNVANLESLNMSQFFWVGIGLAIAYRFLLAISGCITFIALGKSATHNKPIFVSIIIIFSCGLLGLICGFLEVMVFVGMFIDLTVKNENGEEVIGAAEAQYACQSAESILESLPEVILQSVFYMRAYNDPVLREAAGKIVVLVIISIMAAIISIASKYIWIDEYMVKTEAQYLIVTNIDTSNTDINNIAFVGNCFCLPKYISYAYIIRVIWRLMAVTARVVIFALIWVVIGGALLIIIVPMAMLVWYVLVIGIYHEMFQPYIHDIKNKIESKTANIGCWHVFACCAGFGAIMCVGTVVIIIFIVFIFCAGVMFQLGIAILSSRTLYVLRIIENVVLMCIVTIFGFLKFDCKYCAESENRYAFYNYRILTWIVIGWVAIIIHTITSIIMTKIIDKSYTLNIDNVWQFAKQKKQMEQQLNNDELIKMDEVITEMIEMNEMTDKYEGGVTTEFVRCDGCGKMVKYDHDMNRGLKQNEIGHVLCEPCQNSENEESVGLQS